MSVLVLGASHRSAPAEVLEALALTRGEAAKLRAAALDALHVREVVVLATCNRVEIYAEVDRFHGAVDVLTRLLVERVGGIDPAAVVPSLYVHYDAGVVTHLLTVAAGLDSMVLGEAQILGQVKDAIRAAQDDQSAGPALNALFQRALRVGKRVHSETNIDAAGRSLVSVALNRAAGTLGSLADARVCIVGAGSVAALTASTARRAGVTRLTICSRTFERAVRLAEANQARPAAWDDLTAELARADLVVSCTGATGVVVSTAMVEAALLLRSPADSGSLGPLALVDLALPHDVDPAVAALPSVSLVTLANLADDADNDSDAFDVASVESILADEVEQFLAERRSEAVAPTVVALRSMASAVVDAELARLWRRLPELTERQRDEIARALQRSADKVLHEPTVRMKEFAGRVPETSYAAALAELFALDPAAVEAVSGTLGPS